MQNKIFQPKVIIGSITSFIVAAVGIIAVFFPSVFNLEKSSMGEGQFLLSDDESTHKKLWEFLGENQGKVVQLEIAYCADFEKMSFMAVEKPKENWWYDGGGEKLEFKAIDFIPKWFLGLGGEKDLRMWGISSGLEKFAKQNKYAITYYEWLGKAEKINDEPLDVKHYSITTWGDELLEKTYKMDYIGRPPIIAGEIVSFHTYQYGQDVYPNVIGVSIENGGIGFAFKEKDMDFLPKDILISHPSNKNKKYIWVMGYESVVSKYLDKTSSLAKQAQKTCKAKQIKENDASVDSGILSAWGGLPLGYIKGTFYVHDKEVVEEPGLWLITSYNNYGFIETENYSREKFELEPFDKKDLEMRKY